MCKRVTNTGLAANYCAHRTYFLFSSWLDRCMSESYSPCVCGWREVKLGLHLCRHLRRISAKQREREARRRADRMNRKEEDRGSERGKDRQRGEWKRDKIYLTTWVCEVSRHASQLCILLGAVGRIAAGHHWSHKLCYFALSHSRSCEQRGRHFQRHDGNGLRSHAPRISLTSYKIKYKY